ncbi:MAG: hypothetical protein JWM16_369 [Verrucomicrobiales bacterium]|nr:hypothetical protein [Verrucomicrobiales bacterium]
MHRIMKKNRTYALLALASLTLCWSNPASAAQKTYETGYSSITRISADLYKALDKKKRANLMPVPVLLEKNPTPFMEPSTYSDGTNFWQAVYISAGFVDFLNFLAHAKAMEGEGQGEFKRYVGGLGSANVTPPPFQPVSNDKGWSFDTMNHQVSQFNQMAGALIAIEMAHHYLGHYKKYEARLKDAQGNPIAINTLVTPQEWQEAVMKGARNALDCGIGVDGLKAVLETMENKETRPAWSIYFVPPQAGIPKVKRQLTMLEKDFFMIGK